ncbi:MAG: ArgE/DapE family deacylase [Candidatus Thorarchaeota archaeon]
MDDREEKIVVAVESMENDMIDLTCSLVEEASTLMQEASVLELMEKKLASLGLEPAKIPIDPEKLSGHPGWAPTLWSYENRYNLVATRPADKQVGRSALFNGHLDVVSPEPLKMWKQDPFKPLIKDGWLYGRGGGDMKAGVAAMCYAVKAVEKAGFGIGAPVTIETVIEEEASGNGALACRDAGIEAEAVLIPEPFGPTIETTQVGVIWFKVSLPGVAKHALETHSGVNAIEKCYPLFMALRNLEESLNHPIHPAFKHLEHPINLNIGIMKAGDWPSTVPAMAEFHCRLGFFPGITFEEIRGRVVKAIEETASSDEWLAQNPPQVEFYGFRSEGHSLERDLPAFNILNDCHKSLTGRDAEEFASTATTDLRAFVHFGQGEATCFGPVAENIHGSNERVNLASVIHTAKVYALFLSRWCGLVE